MRDQITEMQKRPIHYWYSDGIWEIHLGLFFVLFGLYYILLTLIPSTGPYQIITLAIGQPAIILFGIFGFRKTIRYFKERITYPRTGYISYRTKRKNNRLVGMATGLALGMIFGLIASQLSRLIGTSWIPAFIGVMLAFILYILAYKSNVIRFYVLAVTSIIIGGIVAFSGLDEWQQSAAFFAGVGICFAISGLAALIIYIRNSHLVELEEE